VKKNNVFLLMFRAARGRCLSRVGIVPPKVIITANDPRLCAGSPRRIRSSSPPSVSATVPRAASSLKIRRAGSGLASRRGVTVVAVCTSHSRGQIEECGAHFVVEKLEDVRCEEIKTDEGTRLAFTVEH